MIEISLFGATAVRVDGVTLGAGERGVKPRQILQMLAVELGNPVSKDRLAEGLWEGNPPLSYVSTLESYVCVLRRRLGVGRGKSSALATTHNGYVLDPGRVRVDLDEVRRLVTSAETMTGPRAAHQVERALRLMSGELLADAPYHRWAGRAREDLGRLLTAACTRAARIANDSGDASTGVRLARVATGQGILAEDAWVELMRALSLADRRAEALQAYADLRAGMLEELGVEPSAATQRMYLSVLRGPSEGPAGRGDRHEVRTLLRLLRQALEAGPVLDVPDEPDLPEGARGLLRRSA